MPKKAESPGNLPVGTVTFMFTDIEGSTELLKQLGDQYAEMLEQQRRIMREASKRWDGTEVDTQGDSFFVSFPRATQAISAAVEIQRSIHEHSWPNDVELRLRMGMHTGEPLTWGEGYVGMDVHRAARVAHVGHGGQVLLSETTTALILDELPDGVSLLDLGRHLLRTCPARSASAN
jgi:class 3 adenylate cyclase